MSETMLDDSYESMEYWGSDEGAEDYGDADAEDYDVEGFYGESGEGESAASRRREQRRRRARAALARRRLALARSRARRPAMRPSRPKTAAAAIQRTQADVAKVDLENKVQADATLTALKGLDRRTRGNTQALVAIPALAQLSAQLDDFVPGLDANTKNIVNGFLRFGHAAFLTSPDKGLGNPKVQAAALGALIVGGAAIARRLNDDDDNGDRRGVMTIAHHLTEIPVKGQSRYRVNLDGNVAWTSADDSVASVDASGVVTGKKAGTTTITATRGDDFDKVPVTVVQPSTGK
jgi:hypothetical protein